MDTYLEYMVKRQNNAKIMLLKGLTVTGAAVVGVLLFLVFLTIKVLASFSLLVLVGAAVGGWYIIKSMNLEFEYIITNTDMDVDKIVAQSRRKRLVSINLRQIEMMAPVSPKYQRELENPSIKTRIDASTQDGKNAWFIKTTQKDKGLMLLIFTPDERIIEAVNKAAPRRVLQA